MSRKTNTDEKRKPVKINKTDLKMLTAYRMSSMADFWLTMVDQHNWLIKFLDI